MTETARSPLVLPGRPLSKGRVLVVDDELAVLRLYSRALNAEGYQVFSATDGHTAEMMFRRCDVDAVVSDIFMPGLDGLGLLRSLRQIDRDVPVILATGDGQSAGAQQAVMEGALMYFVKPIDLRALVQSVGHATNLHRLARVVRDGRDAVGGHVVDTENLAARFEAAMLKLWIAYQPIARWDTLEVVAYEALARSDEPSLAAPRALFAAAERLGRTAELGRAIRGHVAAAIPSAPPGARFFVNLHAQELQDDQLYTSAEPLHDHATRVVFEITERDALERVSGLTGRIDRLRAAGFVIALDDLAAGHAGLACFAQLKPSVIKIDLSIVRDLEHDDVKRRIVESVVALCAHTHVELVAEGVETPQERQTLGALGCELQQGYAYGRPQRGFATTVG